MDSRLWEEAYRQAAAEVPVRVDRRMQNILYGDVPTFMELPHAPSARDLEGVDVAFLGMGYEGVKIDSPHTYLPELAAPAGPDAIHYRAGADKAPGGGPPLQHPLLDPPRLRLVHRVRP